MFSWMIESELPNLQHHPPRNLALFHAGEDGVYVLKGLDFDIGTRPLAAKAMASFKS